METASGLVSLLSELPLLEPGQRDELCRAPAGPCADARSLAGELIRKGWLTAYQANQLCAGRGRDLVLGSYVLLERLGAGGMGEVFKARNVKLDRVVALKLIRPERLRRPDAVRRFHREIRAAAQLAHPNIVRAFDAGEVGGTHFLVMEYVQGTDLSRRVKDVGPLPVAAACDYVRQAALGLQHAHERGLVHRDVKPANLLLADDGTVKVLDMGLARVTEGSDGEHSTTMTGEGVMVGTPNYLAPEQTLDAHAVDVRADLYSLGCTLYYLLAGQVPFPGGSLGEKLMKHQLCEPTPVEALRPEVPGELAAVVRKLMAKRPADRFQTPAALAEALGALRAAAAPPTTAAGPDRTQAGDGTACESGPGDAPPALVAALPRAAPTPPRPVVFRRAMLGGVAVAAAAVAGLVAWAVWPRPAHSVLAPDADIVRPRVPRPVHQEAPSGPITDAWLRTVAALRPEEQVEAVAGKLRELNPGFDGVVRHRVEEGAVTSFGLHTDHVRDLGPLRALPGLRYLFCSASAGPNGQVTDLGPLRGLRLTSLACAGNPITDLSPLRGMPLTILHIHQSPLTDLTPLAGMPLEDLSCPDVITDLEVLRGLPLTRLNIGNASRVSDLAPLAGMRLTQLLCRATAIRDLAPLKGMPLQSLDVDATPVRDLTPLRGMALTHFNCSNTEVTDLSPLAGMPLERLYVKGTRVANLELLRGMPLKDLYCDFVPARDGAVLRSIPTLEAINDQPAAAFLKKAAGGD